MKKTGTKEWAEHNVNIQRGCEHGCRYCYARWMTVSWLKKYTAEQWLEPVIDNSKVDADYGKYRGTVMFPSTHDITPRNIEQCICVLRRLLDAGNKVLIVSKPHWSCIPLICETLKEYKLQIEFRFTIGSTSDEVLSFWEPGAPNLAERLSCLRYAYKCGYETSVSCEPYLDPYVPYTYAAVLPYLTNSFWIGKLRDFKRRVDLTGVTDEQMTKFVKPLMDALSDEIVKTICMTLHGHRFVEWKDSVRQIIESGD